MNEILSKDMGIYKDAIYENIIAESFIKNDKYNVSNAIKLINGNIGQNNNIYTIPLYMSFLIGGQEWMNYYC